MDLKRKENKLLNLPEFFIFVDEDNDDGTDLGTFSKPILV